MRGKNKVTVSTRPATARPNSAERRAAEIERLSKQQAELKEQAAARRRQHAAEEGAPPSRSTGDASTPGPTDAP